MCARHVATLVTYGCYRMGYVSGQDGSNQILAEAPLRIRDPCSCLSSIKQRKGVQGIRIAVKMTSE